MHAPWIRPVAATALVLLLAGCQAPDVGGPCKISIPGVDVTAVPGDYLETGVLVDCDTLVCIASPPTSKLQHNPYCSKACVSNADCSSGETGLVCRQVLLDPAFLNQLDPAVKQQYLGNFSSTSFYCAAPLQ